MGGMPDYDAFLLVSFGGPEGPADVMPFLENVTRGRGVPRDRLAEVARHYDVFGGVSPINEQCRDLLSAIGKDFAATGLDLPLYWGNRNWHPFLADTVAQMASGGVRHAIAFVTSAYGSYSSCRQYLDDIEAARAQVRAAPCIDKIRHFFNHRVSSAPSPRPPARRLRHSRQSFGMMRGWFSRRTACPRRWRRPAGQRAACTRRNWPRRRGWSPRSSLPWRGMSALRGWPTRAEAGRRPCPGSAPTSATSSRKPPPPAPRPWSWSRWASSPTTSRCGTTWTSRRRGRPSGSACRWRGRPPPAPIRVSSP